MGSSLPPAAMKRSPTSGPHDTARRIRTGRSAFRRSRAAWLRRLMLAAACLLLSVQLGTADEKTRGKISIWLGYPETLDAFKLEAETSHKKRRSR